MKLEFDSPYSHHAGARALSWDFFRHLVAAGDEGHGARVHAITQPGRRRPVVEDMAEMGVAAGAENFGAFHAEAIVGARGDIFRRDGPEEAGPARAGIELRARFEKRQGAADAVVDAVFVVVVEDPAKGRLSGPV